MEVIALKAGYEIWGVTAESDNAIGFFHNILQ